MSSVVSFAIFILISLILWFVVKKLWALIRYVVFHSIVDKIVITLVDDDEATEGSNKLPNSYSEDDLLHDKNLKKDQLREAERINQTENEFKKQPRRRVIVGLRENAIVGKWTAMIAKKMFAELQQMDPREIQESGYFTALVNAQRRAVQTGINNSNGNQRR